MDSIVCKEMQEENQRLRFRILSDIRYSIKNHNFIETALDENIKNIKIELLDYLSIKNFTSNKLNGYFYINKNENLNDINNYVNYIYKCTSLIFYYFIQLGLLDETDNITKEFEWLEYMNNLLRIFEDSYYDFSKLKDSESVFFDGDVIITDPCYLNKIDEKNQKEISYSEYAEINNIPYMERDTIYGDWSCTTYKIKNYLTEKYGKWDNYINKFTQEDLNHIEQVGEFCADSGMVCVTLLKDIEKFKKFDWYDSRPWTTTLIRNFKGYANFKITSETYTKEPAPITSKKENSYEFLYNKYLQGQLEREYSVQVILNGFDKKTGERITFLGTQTSF